MNASTALRTVRADAGWSQRELARRSGIAQPSISDIESGDRDTTVAKLGQILRAADYAVIAIPSSRPTIAEWAVRLTSLLRRDPGAIEKSLVQIADDLSAADGATRVALCLTPPAPTKNSTLDAVLAALVDHVLSRDGLPRPKWVLEPTRISEHAWDVVTVPRLQEAARATTPEPFRRRNVFIPADFFESV